MQETKSKRLPFLARFFTLFAGLTLGGAVVAAAPASPAAALDPTPHVALKTSMGEIVLELNQEKAPKSVANFLQYVNSGFYKGTVFHRVIDGF
ncbi:MAG: peptidylprolyl isomerase, partial [Janthinobacterium sp.]